MRTILYIIAAILLGIFAGIFFGERTSYIAFIGQVFIMLLQMAVLPYLITSITHSIGSLDKKRAWELFKRGWVPFLFVWILALFVIWMFISLIPAAVPTPFEQAQLQDTEFQSSFLSYLIPENPFYDLTKNFVPAIAIFSLIIGISIMHVPNKESFLSFLLVVNGGIGKIFSWLAKVSPIGVFALIATAAGTMRVEDLEKVQFYLAAYLIFALLMTFFFLPLFLKAFVPVGYKEFFKEVRTGLFIAFATGISVLAIPFITKAMKKFLHKPKPSDECKETTEIITPLSYSFVQVGNLVSILFIFFMGFYMNHPFTEKDQVMISALGIPSSFGSPTTTVNTVRFFMSQLKFPDQATTLYIEMMSITKNFQALLSVVSIYAVSLASVFLFYKKTRLTKKYLFSSLGGLAVVLIACVSLKPFISLDSSESHLGYWQTSIADAIDHPLPSKNFRSLEDYKSQRYGSWDESVFSHIINTKKLRVGYNPLVMPYVYFNEWHELVGYDIAFMYELGRSLGVEQIEFAPYSWETFERDLELGYFDVMVGAIFVNEKRLQRALMSRPYMSADIVLIVEKERKSEFVNYEVLKEKEGLKIATITDPTWVRMVRDAFPNAEVVQLHDIQDFFEESPTPADAFIWTNATSVAWPIEYPEYDVVIPDPSLGKIFLAYAFNRNAANFQEYVNYWLDLQQLQGFTKKAVRYLGVGPIRAT